MNWINTITFWAVVLGWLSFGAWCVALVCNVERTPNRGKALVVAISLTILFLLSGSLAVGLS